MTWSVGRGVAQGRPGCRLVASTRRPLRRPRRLPLLPGMQSVRSCCRCWNACRSSWQRTLQRRRHSRPPCGRPLRAAATLARHLPHLPHVRAMPVRLERPLLRSTPPLVGPPARLVPPQPLPGPPPPPRLPPPASFRTRLPPRHAPASSPLALPAPLLLQRLLRRPPPNRSLLALICAASLHLRVLPRPLDPPAPRPPPLLPLRRPRRPSARRTPPAPLPPL
jgi:hypothetical protein